MAQGHIALRADLMARLTPVQRRTAQYLVLGLRNKDIATKLGTTEQVIKNRMCEMRDRIGADTKLQLAVLLVSPN